MGCRADARGGKINLSRLGFGQGDQFLHRIGWKRRMRHQPTGQRGDLGYWSEILNRVVRKFTEQGLVNRVGADLGHLNGIAVRLGSGCKFRSQHAGGARPVVDHKRLPPTLG